MDSQKVVGVTKAMAIKAMATDPVNMDLVMMHTAVMNITQVVTPLDTRITTKEITTVNTLTIRIRAITTTITTINN